MFVLVCFIYSHYTPTTPPPHLPHLTHNWIHVCVLINRVISNSTKWTYPLPYCGTVFFCTANLSHICSLWTWPCTRPSSRSIEFKFYLCLVWIKKYFFWSCFELMIIICGNFYFPQFSWWCWLSGEYIHEFLELLKSLTEERVASGRHTSPWREYCLKLGSLLPWK